MWCFIQVLANLGEAMTDEEIGDMVKEADLDLDGQVSFDGGCFARGGYSKNFWVWMCR